MDPKKFGFDVSVRPNADCPYRLGRVGVKKRSWLGTCQKLAGGRGVDKTEGGSQLFETAERGGVMKNGQLKRGGSCKYVSVIM